jgi:GNAT superfamily N-acetyltransferase
VTQEPSTCTERYGSYSLRPARAADLDSLIELLLALQDQIETSNPDLWRMKPGARRNLKGQISARLKAANSCALIAEHEEDGVVGVIFGRIVVNNRYTPSRAGQVDQAFVGAAHRRAGVGSRLVALLCRFFASEDVVDVTLRYVVGNEEAAKFWSALGFSPRIITAGTGREALERRLT